MISKLLDATLVYFIASTHTDPDTGVRTEVRHATSGTFASPGKCRRFLRVDLIPNIEVKYPAGVPVGRQANVTWRCLPEFSKPPRKPLQAIQDDLSSLFTPIEQWQGDVGINHSGEVPFTGDCDDYYTAAFNQLHAYYYEPYVLTATVRKTGVRHIMACVDVGGVRHCLDNRNASVIRAARIKRQYRELRT